MPWKNGQIPDSDLVVFKRGRNSTDGDWYWALSPATLARHNALVRRAQRRTGRTLAPSDGYSTYRPIPAQETARRLYGNGAAVVGTSSHGGWWEQRETLAIDYGNWAYVYANHGGQAAFYEDCRAVGLTPGMISRARGYPEEPWHVIDLNPRSAVPAFADATPFDSEETELMGALDQIQKMHDVTRNFVVDQVRAMIDATIRYLVEQTQRQQDVTRAFLRDVTQAQQDVTRNYIVDSVVAALAKVTPSLDKAELHAAVVEAIGDVEIPAVDIDAIAKRVNDEADQRERERLGESPTGS